MPPPAALPLLPPPASAGGLVGGGWPGRGEGVEGEATARVVVVAAAVVAMVVVVGAAAVVARLLIPLCSPRSSHRSSNRSICRPSHTIISRRHCRRRHGCSCSCTCNSTAAAVVVLRSATTTHRNCDHNCYVLLPVVVLSLVPVWSSMSSNTCNRSSSRSSS